MATSKSALKRQRTSRKAKIRHKSKRNDLKTYEKKFRTVVAAAELTTTGAMLKELYSKFDKAVKSGTIHRNKADRKKAQLAMFLHKAQPKPS